MSDRLKAMLTNQEGRRNKLYTDNSKEGIPTIGIGHNLRDKPISDAAIDQIFSDDLEDAMNDVEKSFPWSATLDEVRHDVLVDMVFNMGIVRVNGFKKTLAALQAGDWETAANEMLDSLWASEVGNRARVLAEMVRTGQYGT